MEKRLAWSCLCSFLLVFNLVIIVESLEGFWVDANKGDDSNDGSYNRPFKTITKARDSIRIIKNTTGLLKGNFTVTVNQGDYEFIETPLEFTSVDSGTPNTIIQYYSNFDSGKGHLTAGRKINYANHISPVTDPIMRSLLQDKENIVQVNLRELGINDFGDLLSGMLGDCANNKVELFSPHMNMVLARYPNINIDTGLWQWLSAGKVTDKQKSFDFNGNSTVTERILSWKNTSSLWLHGYWSYDWADNYVKVDQVFATNTSFLASDKTPPVYGFIANARYYALNILEELDAENEYYIDRGSGILYLFASMARKLSSGIQDCVSVGETVLTMDSVSYLSFVGFDIDCAKSTAVKATNVNNVTIYEMDIHDTGGAGITVYGSNNILSSLSVTRTGCGGIHLSGGDQKSLTRGNNKLEQSTVSYWSNWKRTYNPGLSWGGVGNNYTQNQIMNGPHSGVLGGGNDCLFESNVFDTLCFESSDSGGFYTGRSWIDRGNIIRGNTFKNIFNKEKTHLGAPSVQAIYLDDQMSGYIIENNQFFNCHCGSFIGGGRRNIIRDNTYHDCDLCVHVDDRGLTWQKADCSSGGMFEQQLKSVNWNEPPWSTHYPELHNIINDHPCVPVYNMIENNKCCQSKQFIDASDNDLNKWMVTVKNNTNTC